MQKIEANTLADMLESSRQLSRYYLSFTAELDLDRRFMVHDFHTNSIHWIVAHMAWAQDFLILKGVGNKSMDLPWFEAFRIGKESPETEHYPPYAETLDAFNNVHTASIELIRTLTSEQLDMANHSELSFGPDNTKRAVIRHAIRHESMHCGHLSWLLRMHGRKVI